MLKHLRWMREISRIPMILVLAGFAVLANSEGKRPLHKDYRGPDMPNGVALRVARVYLEPTDTAVMLIKSSTAASDATAESLVQYLVQLVVRAERELLQSHRQLACNRTLNDGEMLRAYNGIEDLRITVYEKYYAIAKAELDPELSSVLQQWLDRVKGSSVYTVRDKEKAFANSLGDARTRLEGFCAATEGVTQ